jgi:phage baseplate assembly protein W
VNPEAINNSFLGRGWSFPPSFNNTTHELHMAEGVEDIRQSLHILLTTAIGERLMQPKFGCNMDELIFESLDTTTKTIIIDKITTAILYFEPRIDAKRIELNTQNELEGEVLVEIDYVVRATNSRFNFVFPFYLKEGSELNLLTTNTPLAQ